MTICVSQVLFQGESCRSLALSSLQRRADDYESSSEKFDQSTLSPAVWPSSSCSSASSVLRRHGRRNEIARTMHAVEVSLSSASVRHHKHQPLRGASLCLSSFRSGTELVARVPRFWHMGTGIPTTTTAAAVAQSKDSVEAVVPAGRAEPVMTPAVEALLDAMKWDQNGFVVAIAQHADTGAILMQGFADRDAVSATLASRRATFFSRSRKCLWTKGETSGNFIDVMDVFLDCDRDSVIYLGKPDGPTCHTGEETCYFIRAEDIVAGGLQHAKENKKQALTSLYSLEEVIRKRKELVGEAATSSGGLVPKPSWTRKLLENPDLLCSKVREEADELCRTLEDGEGKERAASEMADLLYHAMVLLSLQGVNMEDVAEVLRGRFPISGIEEKTSRKAS